MNEVSWIDFLATLVAMIGFGNGAWAFMSPVPWTRSRWSLSNPSNTIQIRSPRGRVAVRMLGLILALFSIFIGSITWKALAFAELVWMISVLVFLGVVLLYGVLWAVWPGEYGPVWLSGSGSFARTASRVLSMLALLGLIFWLATIWKG